MPVQNDRDESRRPAARVLVVDDEALVGRALARELRRDFEVLVAEGPPQALALLEGTPGICAVVSDLMMGGPVGLELLEEVRRRLPGCARILVSGTVAETEVERALRGGIAHGFVAKPWGPGEVLAAVHRALAGRGLGESPDDGRQRAEPGRPTR